MKKILMAAGLSAALLTTASIADEGVAPAKADWKTSAVLSLGQAEAASENGVNLGLDYKFEKNVYNDIYVGVGIGGSFFSLDSIQGLEDDLGIAIDLYPTVSYEIPDTKVSVNALAGYSFGQYGSAEFDGVTYGVGADYAISDKYAVGVSYKTTDADIEGLTEDVDLDRTSLYIRASF